MADDEDERGRRKWRISAQESRILRERLKNAQIKHIRKESIPDRAPGAPEIEEAKSISNKNYDEISREADHRRSENFKDAVSTGFLFLFWVAFVAILIAGAFWFYHLVLPPQCHFLAASQVERIGQYLFGGFISTFVTSYAGKVLK